MMDSNNVEDIVISNIQQVKPIHERRNSQVLVHHINEESQFDENHVETKGEEDGSMMATQFSEHIHRLKPKQSGVTNSAIIASETLKR